MVSPKRGDDEGNDERYINEVPLFDKATKLACVFVSGWSNQFIFTFQRQISFAIFINTKSTPMRQEDSAIRMV